MTNKFATIYKEDLEYISKCMLDYPNIETGGDFFGFWNNLGLPVILYVTGPGEKCYRHSTFFRQDIDFLIEIGSLVYKEHGLQHIGSWHSHHKLGLAVPSHHDCNTMARAIRNNNLSKFFMILGNITCDGGTTIKGFLFDSENSTKYKETSWRILKSENIISKVINEKIDKRLKYEAKTKRPFLQDLKIHKVDEIVTYPIDLEPKFWIGSEKGKSELNEVFNWFKSRFYDAKMFLTNSHDLEIKSQDITITFYNDFPNSHPKIEIGSECLTKEMSVFNYNDYSDLIKFLSEKLSPYLEVK